MVSKMVLSHAGALLSCLIIAKACMDPPGLYHQYPSPINRYFSKPTNNVMEMVGGVPENVDRNLINLLTRRRSERRYGKRQSKSCPSSRGDSWHDTNVEDRALCGWHYLPKHNSSRYPNIVVEAESTCVYCSAGFVNDPSSMGRCEPVFRSFPVLERTGCNGGIYQYQEAYISVKVAFVCARPRTSAPDDISHYNDRLEYSALDLL